MSRILKNQQMCKSTFTGTHWEETDLVRIWHWRRWNYCRGSSDNSLVDVIERRNAPKLIVCADGAKVFKRLGVWTSCLISYFAVLFFSLIILHPYQHRIVFLLTMSVQKIMAEKVCLEFLSNLLSRVSRNFVMSLFSGTTLSVKSY